MRNLCYFCHYHQGTPKERAIKIAGSFLIVALLTVFSMSSSLAATKENEAEYYNRLFPDPAFFSMAGLQEGLPQPPPGAAQFDFTPREPGHVLAEPPQFEKPPMPPLESRIMEGQPPMRGEKIMGERGQDQPMRPLVEKQPMDRRVMEGQPPMRDEKESGRPMEGQPSDRPSDMREGMEGTEGAFADDEQREKFELEMMKRERGNALQDIGRQKRELNQLIKKLARTKGAAELLASAKEIQNKIGEFEKAIRAAQESDEIQASLEEYREAELWEEVNKIRRLVELPKELNMILREATRLKRMIAQKQFQRIGVDMALFKQHVQGMLDKHAAAQKSVQSGELEEAEEMLEDLRENHPGECVGSLHMLRGVQQQLRPIRDKEFKAEVEELIADPIGALNQGECRDARETLEAIQRELGPVVWKKILQSQQRKQQIPDDVLDKIERLKEKMGGVDEGVNAPEEGGELLAPVQ